MINAYQAANGTWSDLYYNVYSNRLGHIVPTEQSVGHVGLQDNDVLELRVSSTPSLFNIPNAPRRESDGPSTPRLELEGRKKSSKKGMRKSSKKGKKNSKTF